MILRPHHPASGSAFRFPPSLLNHGYSMFIPHTTQVRRRAVVPAFHKQYYEAMASMFASCTNQTVKKIEAAIDRQVRCLPRQHYFGLLQVSLCRGQWPGVWTDVGQSLLRPQIAPPAIV